MIIEIIRDRNVGSNTRALLAAWYVVKDIPRVDFMRPTLANIEWTNLHLAPSLKALKCLSKKAYFNVDQAIVLAQRLYTTLLCKNQIDYVITHAIGTAFLKSGKDEADFLSISEHLTKLNITSNTCQYKLMDSCDNLPATKAEFYNYQSNVVLLTELWCEVVEFHRTLDFTGEVSKKVLEEIFEDVVGRADIARQAVSIIELLQPSVNKEEQKVVA